MTMAIEQFLLSLTFRRTGVTDEGTSYVYYQGIDVDLVGGDVTEFLSRVPDDIDEQSCITATIRPVDGEVIAFVDGVVPIPQTDGTYGPVDRVARIDDGGYADDLRKTARLMADRAYARAHNPEGSPDKKKP